MQVRLGDRVQTPLGHIGVVEVGFGVAAEVRITDSVDQTVVGKRVRLPVRALKVVASKPCITVKLGTGKLYCEVASNPQETTVGLAKHAGLAKDAGMLFPFKPPRFAEFHMSTVRFPLDLIFVGPDSKVSKVVANLQPGTPGSWGQASTAMVVEANGGWSAANGVTIGSFVELNPYEDEEKEGAQSIDTLRSITEARVKAEIRKAIRLGQIPAIERFANLSDLDRKIVAAHSLDAAKGLLSAYANHPGFYRFVISRMIQNDAVVRHVAKVPLNDVILPIQTGYECPCCKHPNCDLHGADGHKQKAAQELVLMLTPEMFQQLMSGQDIMSPHVGAAFDRISNLLETNADDSKLKQAWNEVSPSLDFWERDALVRSLDKAGYARAIGILKYAQEHGKLTQSPGAVNHLNPNVEFGDHAIPADMPGLVDSYNLEHWDSSNGYDQSNPTLQDGDGPGYRPGSKIAGGGIHPGDRVKITEQKDGLKKDDAGVATEIQEGVVLVKLDGQPIPRWLSNDLLQVDKAKDDILKPDSDSDKGSGGSKGGWGHWGH
jgi:uncharacterized membrane protein (UPF0127 family)